MCVHAYDCVCVKECHLKIDQVLLLSALRARFVHFLPIFSVYVNKSQIFKKLFITFNLSISSLFALQFIIDDHTNSEGPIRAIVCFSRCSGVAGGG